MMLFNKAYKVRDYETGHGRTTKDGTELLAMAHVGTITKGPADLDRSFWMVASNEARDRDGDVIRAKGWNLKAFKKNPVGLFMHDYRQLPVFRVPDIKVDGSKLMALMHFPEELGGLSDDVYNAFQARALNASSVGFAPEEVRDDEKTREEFGLPAENAYGNGILFWKQELFELSAVTVPSNPEALAQIKAMEGGEQLKEMLQRSEDFVIELSTEQELIDEVDDDLYILATDYSTMRLTLEEAGWIVTESTDEPGVLEVTLDLPTEVGVVLDLSPEPTPGESLDEATLQAVAERIISDARKRREERIKSAVKREIDYHKGLVVEDKK